MKILIISNNALSLDNSNGRTILNMLGKFKKDEILNIFINGGTCELEKAIFYKINEKKLIKFSKKLGNFILFQTEIATSHKVKKRSSFKLIVRSILWSSKRLFRELLSVTKSFNPDVILIQCGDSDFLINISCKLSKALKIDLYSFNSEDYIFKKWDYIRKREREGLIFKIFKHRLQKSYDELFKVVKKSIYLTDDLKELYKIKYPSDIGYTIYNSSFLQPVKNINASGDIVYCGNLGVGRHNMLIEISNIIFNETGKKVVIYSQTNNQQIINDLLATKSITFNGKISYKENIDILSCASLILHCESFDCFYSKDTQHSFSTKIADSLSLCLPFVVMAPINSSIYNYLKKYDCAYAFSNSDELNFFLKSIKKNPKLLVSKIDNARNVAKKNHDYRKNSELFYKIVNGEY